MDTARGLFITNVTCNASTGYGPVGGSDPGAVNKRPGVKNRGVYYRWARLETETVFFMMPQPTVTCPLLDSSSLTGPTSDGIDVGNRNPAGSAPDRSGHSEEVGHRWRSRVREFRSLTASCRINTGRELTRARCSTAHGRPDEHSLSQLSIISPRSQPLPSSGWRPRGLRQRAGAVRSTVDLRAGSNT